ncbi:hypothetical protein Pdw03_1055 [Penicillium digitatum]|uniref:Uncharacterized protein n=1 Tax=Penicillium digitatum TaxID=36651 RepID=A0A7T6XSB5_PENDI|nr:hypothetical protein Pdw03_1055 [Penicillium digitatum]
MNENLNYSAANGNWHAVLLDSPVCHNCLQLHDLHACPTPLSNPLLRDSADALSLPPRSLKSHRSSDPVDHIGRKLKRRTAALHLNRSSPLTISYPVSSSSIASSPPPLSPSYSHSIVSHWSEEPEIGEAQTVQLQSTQSPRLPVVSDLGTRARPNRKRVNTFRERFQHRAQTQTAEARRAPQSQTSDSMLSLDLARIVSYIEDVDNCSMVSMDNQRDSTFSLDQGLDPVSLSQFADAPVPSFYSTNSLYTSLPANSSTPMGQPTDERSLLDFPVNEHSFNYWSQPVQRTENNDIRTDFYNERAASPSPHIAFIMEKSKSPTLGFSCRPSTPSTQLFYPESEIGEPGSPVYANGDWAQVDERDRGILFDPREDELTPDHHYHDNIYLQEHEEPPTPRETPLETPSGSPMHSPMYSNFDSAYPYPRSFSTSKLPNYPGPFDPYTFDPVYFDPHVQSVLAAANAETMGLRGSPARAPDELQRQRVRSDETSPRFEFQRRKSDERKAGVQKKGLRKFFSWKSGN